MQRAFAATAARLGLETRPEWLRSDLHPLQADSGERQFRALQAAGPLPDGVLVGDVHLLEGFAGAAGSSIPRLVSHSFTGTTVAAPPGASLLEVDTAEFGRQAHVALARLIAGETVDRHIVLPPRLIPAP